MSQATPSTSLFILLKRLWGHLERRRQRQFVLLLGLMLLSAFAEVVSIGAILPFLAVLTAPERVLSYPFVFGIAKYFGIVEPRQLLMPLTVAFAMVALIAGGVRILLLWVSTRLTAVSGSELSIEVYRHTLYQPYKVHVSRNSSEIINGITNKVNGVIFGVMLPLSSFISSSMALVAIVLALFAIDPFVASFAVFGFGASYGLITLHYRSRLHRNGANISREQTQVLKALQEGLGGIRDVLLDGSQPAYCEIYRKADLPYRRAAGDNAFVGQGPRYAIEAIGMVLITVLAFGLSQKPGGMATALPVLGALAMGAQRLLPALQQIYSAWTSIASSHVQLADVIEMLEQPLPEEAKNPFPLPLNFKDAVCFNRVRFRYACEGPWVVDDLTFTIQKGARIGFVGTTGSGKSTTMDLLMGLLTPNEGQLLVDGKSITAVNLRSWQRTIAHVPQTIYLADASVAENIAFGIPASEIDMDRVILAARQAQIAEFIESRPDGYHGRVGERGGRLSGGQRQRIGIARALYKQASVLVFDEATSSLDNTTEQAVMDAIEGVSRDVTILMIAHRLTTLKRCDVILQLDHGKIKKQGSYDTFREFAPGVSNTPSGGDADNGEATNEK